MWRLEDKKSAARRHLFMFVLAALAAVLGWVGSLIQAGIITVPYFQK